MSAPDAPAIAQDRLDWFKTRVADVTAYGRGDMPVPVLADELAVLVAAYERERDRARLFAEKIS